MLTPVISWASEGLGAVPDSFWDSCVDALWSTQDETCQQWGSYQLVGLQWFFVFNNIWMGALRTSLDPMKYLMWLFEILKLVAFAQSFWRTALNCDLAFLNIYFHCHGPPSRRQSPLPRSSARIHRPHSRRTKQGLRVLSRKKRNLTSNSVNSVYWGFGICSYSILGGLTWGMSWWGHNICWANSWIDLMNHPFLVKKTCCPSCLYWIGVLLNMVNLSYWFWGPSVRNIASYRCHPPMVKEKLIGPEVTEPVPGNFLFDKFRGLSQSPKIFGYLSDGDGKCLQATCLHITFWAETQIRLVSFVESDLEQAMQYRLWGPYHGYPLWRWSQGKEYAPCKCKCPWLQHHHMFADGDWFGINSSFSKWRTCLVYKLRANIDRIYFLYLKINILYMYFMIWHYIILYVSYLFWYHKTYNRIKYVI